jgi:mannose-1-phosphate guanylyltransferase
MEHKSTHVILTGGVGSRLWPLSRKSQPKQYLDILMVSHYLK